MPLLWLSSAFLLGILFESGLPLPSTVLGIAVVASFGWFVVDRAHGSSWWRKYTPLMPALILTTFFLGGMRMSLAYSVPVQGTLAYENDQGQARLTGWVSQPPDIRESAVYVRMRITEIEKPDPVTDELSSSKTKGDCLVQFPTWVELKLGDMVQFYAEPRTPSSNSDFSYRDYLSRQGIESVAYFPQSIKVVGNHSVGPVRIWLEEIRQSARKTIFALFPQPESGLLAGILLGLDNDLPPSLAQAYRDTGTAHIIAISGFNMAILAGLLMAFNSKLLNSKWAFLLTAAGLSLYSVLVGGSPSVVRAAVMAVIAMGGRLIGRQSTGVNALFLTAALMCLFNPYLLWDASFQLSFAATLGLVLFASPMQVWTDELFNRHLPEEQANRFSGFVSEYFLFTLAAQFVTLPVIALQFRRVSISSLLSNPLVLPVQPAVLVAGGLTTVAGMIFKPLGRVGAFVSWPLLAYTNRMVTWLAKLTGESIAISRDLALGIAGFCLASLLLFAFRRPIKKWVGHVPMIWFVLILFTIVLSVWTEVLHRPDGLFHVEMIRAGDEADVVISSTNGEKVVINPGKNVNELTASISQSLSPWRNSVLAAILTDRKSAQTLHAFDERLPVQQAFLAPSLVHPIEELQPIAIDLSIPSSSLETVDVLALGDDLKIHFLAADQNASALLIEYIGCRILIPGGLDPARLRQLNSQPLTSLTAMILTPDDLLHVPPTWWEQWTPGVIFWLDTSNPPIDSWTSLGMSSAVELVSDGHSYLILSR